MKRLFIALGATWAGPALAHGIHGPTPESLHALVHAARPELTVLAVAMALYLGWLVRRNRE